MASLSIRDVYKTYPNGVPVLKGVDIDIEDGQFLILVGGSGCGKSTLLNMIAGLETVTSGEIRIDGKVVNDLSPKDRDIAMVFQSYALYPSMTVRENISFGLNIRKVPKSEQQQIVDRVSQMLQIQHLLDRKPGQLSGGQRQRVAMGRALARDPALFLFDEPLSNLDAKLRIEMRAEIKLLHQRLGTTIVYVTHDQIEAMTLGDRIAVMKDGVVQQFGAPQDIYDSPSNLFVAGFIGAPPMNFINGRLVGQGSGVALEIDTGVTRGVLNLPFDAGKLNAHVGREVILGLRPERITDVRHAHNGDASHLQPLDVRVDVTEPTGPDTHVFAQVNGKRIVSRVHPAANPQPDQTLSLLFDVSKAVLFDPASEERIA
ncbi:sn-glycerol-3-phosphate ABC transporter ATP-binding protein UgpC [Burkholderia stagnalis]|uniref:Sugar ABC transporter ATP-binding protein n=1 Tax=Burkholderia stagnalis TaxID=1503054 RepID=A0A107ZFQ5_9BURK|nr:sn-glycerol-3-phosphate ABC transporter ATP-binding protein UgpC [Burkholderia stagnalis]AOK52077.1 sugar ABC transporter ATP-binding protein [Burkholderia stagnalis]KVL88512.1 sugar ABC transporter ATP-binding protein [Burkholderia stagnalis]KVL99274.1 sugar ABC transporter ATP-binding protein [Burkholderia stagnalis]KVM03067.1 sugar ABC transporter ATP-binding protein [Burkholderia stagnalis]KVM87792.1 sugar ABC transporter ATP-binding protein [Burkholderia stagnalis]